MSFHNICIDRVYLLYFHNLPDIFFLHFPVAGISGGKDKGCNSLVLAGGYKDDHDDGEEFIYSGTTYLIL